MHSAMRGIFCLPSFLAVLAWAAPSPAQVQEAPQAMVTPRVMGLGGGGNAVSATTSGIFVNPGAMAQSRAYHVDSLVLFDPSVNRWAFGGAIADTTRERFGAGVSYVYSTSSGGEFALDSHEVRLAVSANLAESISVGLTGRYMDYTGRASANGRRGTSYEGVSLDAGVLFRPIRVLTLGVTGYSLTSPDTALSPLALGTGIGFFPIENLSFTVDGYFDFGTRDTLRMRWSGGAELMLQKVPVRLGYAFDDTRWLNPVHLVTAGLGYIDQRFGVEASMRQEVAGGSQTTLLLSLRYFHSMM